MPVRRAATFGKLQSNKLEGEHSRTVNVKENVPELYEHGREHSRTVLDNQGGHKQFPSCSYSIALEVPHLDL